VSIHLLQHYGNGKGILRAQPSLEIWQKIRTEEMLRAHLEGEIRIADLATACQLSPSHFSGCFRQSFGTSVHQWLIKLRIDTAKNLLREPELSLAEVGFRSAFCDQAAFTRAFTTLEGTTPFRWRKLNGRSADAGSYAPVTVLVDERADGVHISYDRMASLLAPYGNRDALSIARDLDAKVEDVLRQAAA
jgi:AraC family transcriptional regulator